MSFRHVLSFEVLPFTDDALCKRSWRVKTGPSIQDEYKIVRGQVVLFWMFFFVSFKI